MKRIEKILIKIVHFLDKPGCGIFIGMICLMITSFAMIIFIFRKKDQEDIEQQKVFDSFFKHNQTL